MASGPNESAIGPYDYLYDNSDNVNSNGSTSGLFGGSGNEPQHLAFMLAQLFSKISDNPNNSKTSTSAGSSSSNETHSYRLLALLSLWFVLILNPIVILFGVTGNLLATYILIRCNIAKLPVSFYTIMLNISDTLNLLIPVLIFWLDNCFNRTPERGYFRDKSNFLCKALMCPDQLFAALSAWYMCAISFNRWYSVCRPSSYFFRTSKTTNGAAGKACGLASGNGCETSRTEKQAPSTPFAFLLNFSCLKHNRKFRDHLHAFRSIGCITLMGILSCLYPIFMHELRPINPVDGPIFDRNHKLTRTTAVVLKRCNYSQKHEYAYDFIGIILSCLLHILPLTFVAAMNLMIIVRLKQRQRLMSASSGILPSQKKKPASPHSERSILSACKYPLEKLDRHQHHHKRSHQKIRQQSTGSATIKMVTHKDQGTSTDLPVPTSTPLNQNLTVPIKATAAKRHHSRDRTITIMLVSVALSYLILTLPYRLFWLYNVYTKRMHPEKLKSSIFLLKMHYIDHVLRTIRNIHYGTNFLFFIFLSKTFRRRFRQIFIEKLFRAKHDTMPRHSTSSLSNHSTHVKAHRQRRSTSRASRRTKDPNRRMINDDRSIGIDNLSRSIFDEIPSFVADARPHEKEEIVPILELEHHALTRYGGE